MGLIGRPAESLTSALTTRILALACSPPATPATPSAAPAPASSAAPTCGGHPAASRVCAGLSVAAVAPSRGG